MTLPVAGYVLKPYDETRFGKVLTRVVEHIATSRAAPATSERIAIRSAGEVVFVAFPVQHAVKGKYPRRWLPGK